MAGGAAATSSVLRPPFTLEVMSARSGKGISGVYAAPDAPLLAVVTGEHQLEMWSLSERTMMENFSYVSPNLVAVSVLRASTFFGGGSHGDMCTH
mgnify:CR=1 FL=1